MVRPWVKIYIKSALHLNEVQDSSVNIAVTSPSEPRFHIQEEALWGLTQFDNYATRYLMTKEFMVYGVFPMLTPLFNSVRRVLSDDGVFIFNVGVPDRGSSFGLFLDKLDLLSASTYFPYWWSEFILLHGFHLKLNITVIRGGFVTVTPQQVATGVIPSAEQFFVFSKGPETKFRVERMPEKACYTTWISVTDRVKTAKQLNEEFAVSLPSPFDEGILERLFNLFSDEGDLILDPMAGSGTTAVVATKMNRNTILYEINKTFESAIRKRVEASGAEIVD